MTKELFQAISEWQKLTFGQATAESKINHLREEINELQFDIHVKAPEQNIRMEFADCFFLLFGAAAAHGLTYEDICQAIADKFEINKKRIWGKPDKLGVVKHIDKPENF